MGMDDDRQLARRHAHGQRQVAVDLQAVARGVAHRFHRCHVAFQQPRLDLAQLGQLARGGVVQVARALRAVVVGRHDEAGLVPRLALQRDLVAAQLAFQVGVDLGGGRIQPLALRLPGHVADLGQHLALVRIGQPRDVDLGVLEYQRAFAGGMRVEFEQRGLVAAAVGADVDAPVVEREEQRRDGFLEIRGQDGTEFLGLAVAVEQGVVDPVRGHRQPQPAVVVGGPAGDVAGVLRDQFFPAGGHFDAEHVEHLWVPPVVGQQHVGVVVDQVVHHVGAHAVIGREVGRLGRAVQRHRQQMEVLVAAEILDVQDVARPLPEESAHVPFGLAGQGPRRAGGNALFVQRLHVHVLPALGRRQEGQVAAVGRNAIAGTFRLPEEIAHVVALDEPYGGGGSRGHGAIRERGKGMIGKHSTARCRHRPGPVFAAFCFSRPEHRA